MGKGIILELVTNGYKRMANKRKCNSGMASPNMCADCMVTEGYISFQNISIRYILMGLLFSDSIVYTSNGWISITDENLTNFPIGYKYKLQPIFIFPLSILHNILLHQAIFSNEWKEAHVMPYHKGESRESITNYIPISWLFIVAKVLGFIINNFLFSPSKK